jgi:hypothetical protein
LAQRSYSNAIEQGVYVLFISTLEHSQILEYLRVDIVNFLVVPNRVFTEEVEGDFAGLVERDVFAAKRATTNSIRLVLTLLVARTKSVLIDEVDGGCALACRRQLHLEICFIVCTNAVDRVLLHHQRVVTIGVETTYLQLACLLELITIALALDGAGSRKEDVFALAVDILFPMREPSDSVVVDH